MIYAYITISLYAVFCVGAGAFAFVRANKVFRLRSSIIDAIFNSKDDVEIKMKKLDAFHGGPSYNQMFWRFRKRVKLESFYTAEQIKFLCVN